MFIFVACGKREYVDETMGDWTEEKITEQLQEEETTFATEEKETENVTTKDEDKKFVGYYEYPTEEGMKINELEKACHRFEVVFPRETFNKGFGTDFGNRYFGR